MAKLALFVERATVRCASEMNALLRFREAAHARGHELDLLFRLELNRIGRYDGLLLRAFTDPLNTTFIASRTAALLGKRVIDDPESILVCCDKVHMYRRLMRSGVPIPATRFVERAQLTPATAARLFDELGTPLVLKAPSSSFSKFVEKVQDLDAFVSVGQRFLRRADRLVVQRYVPSRFDWRVGTLGGRALFACRYVMAPERWRIRERDENGRTVECAVQAVELAAVPPRLLEMALAAARAIGNGLYGVDLKEIDGDYVVIEVNDNPNIDAGYEDTKNPELYAHIVSYLAGDWGEDAAHGTLAAAVAAPAPHVLLTP